MFDHLLELYHRDDSNKWSIIGFSEEITQVEPIEVNSTHLIWSSALIMWNKCHLLNVSSAKIFNAQ